jgi:hypothetical protein
MNVKSEPSSAGRKHAPGAGTPSWIIQSSYTSPAGGVRRSEPTT